MDQIDLALQKAWFAMLERVERDPEELARRRARAARIRQRPVRPWCIALRAGDRRIDDWGLSWSVDDDALHGRPHEVRLTQWDLNDLTRPVDLGPWPGVRISEAAKLLGRGTPTVLKWARSGALHSEVYDRRVFGLGGTFGGPMLSVWSPSRLLDPQAQCARRPHRMWGTLWQHLAKQVPAEWACTLQRVPSPSPPFGGRGGVMWNWVCPGRTHDRATEVAPHNSPSLTTTRSTPSHPSHPRSDLGASRQRPTNSPPPHPSSSIPHPSPCGRLVRTLYLPLPCFTIADYRGEIERLGIHRPPWADLRGQPMACKHCWGIIAMRLTANSSNNDAWNLFISHVTGGMLTGSEVPRPAEDAPLEPRRAAPHVRGWRPHTAERRKRVREMLIAGATYTQIATELGATWRTVSHDAREIYRAAGISPQKDARWALVRKSTWAGAAEAETARRLQALNLTPRQRQLARLLVQGWSMSEIATELGIKTISAYHLAHLIYRRLNIHSRWDLRALVIPPEAAPPATSADTPPPATRAAG